MAQRKNRTPIRNKAQARITDLKLLRAEKKELEAEIDEVQQEGIALLDKLDQKSITFELEGRTITGTKVEGSTLEFDVAKLKKRLGTSLWNRVSTRTLDKAKLESLLAAGDIDPKIVAACSDEKPKKPYIRVNEK